MLCAPGAGHYELVEAVRRYSEHIRAHSLAAGGESFRERIRVPTVQPADTWFADMALTAVTCLLCCHVGFAAAKIWPRTLTCTRCGNKSQHELAKLIRPLSPAERRAEAQTWARYVGKRLGYRRTDQHVEGERAFTIGL